MTPAPLLHVAIIPDGNRRWAKKQGLAAWRGHETSAENFRTLLDAAEKDGRIGTLTFWCFSTENWKRDKNEVEKLMGMLEKYLRTERAELKRKGIRVAHSGRTDRLSPALTKMLDEIQQDTPVGSRLTLHLAIDYGGRDEVTRAIRRLDGAEPTEEAIRAHLDHPELPDIDLIIRTSGERRTSNFCLWQSTYAEWMFSPKLFPEFGTEDLKNALDAFGDRSRRFGA